MNIKKMTKNKEGLILNTQQVIEALGGIFCSPAYAMLTQVRNGTGYERNARTADAMFMSLWPSRGIYLAGIEVKVSRSDWMKELMDPQKAEDLAKYCDYWYLAVGDESIVKEGELPETWGLMVPDKKNGMKIIKEAKRLKPEPIDRLFLAALMRNVTDRTIAKDLIDTRLKEFFRKGQESANSEVKYTKDRNIELEKAIADFEKASGVKISTWYHDNKDIGEAVKAVLAGKDKMIEKKLKILGEKAQNIFKFIEGQKISEYEL